MCLRVSVWAGEVTLLPVGGRVTLHGEPPERGSGDRGVLNDLGHVEFHIAAPWLHNAEQDERLCTFHTHTPTAPLSLSVSVSLRCYWSSLKRTVRAMRSGGRVSGRGSGVTSHEHLSLRWSVSWINTMRSSSLMAGTHCTLRLMPSAGGYKQTIHHLSLTCFC